MKDIRYGIYLRPDPRTCWVQAQLNVLLYQQFGVVSAAAFPPHATLVGNLKTEATPDELVERVGDALRGVCAFPVFNKGIERSRSAFVFNVNENGQGGRNEPFARLAADMKAALLPVSLPIDDFLVTPLKDYEFKGHLSLVSHDLMVDDSRAAEIGEFLEELHVEYPPMSMGNVVMLYETTTDDWRGHWWTSLQCHHLRSWTLPNEFVEESAEPHVV
ncbi:hypothetical protein SAMN05443377_1224 [Propionibacterium cyclohexanicum]|uniref:2'-5' RNA ligase n=1 Tax=Propionibacterium cyclohexanicum TaxID=64702 RepID=A0A1H9TEZ5_9ACTN|nr:heme utilization protein [Propionibacterium cyclohexanicum]SER95544.1 hypothetical protein SAMN05443377_1224 [Propionibacterium cyclohexanicum]